MDKDMNHKVDIDKEEIVHKKDIEKEIFHREYSDKEEI